MNVITNPISNIPKNEKSHVHGWSQLWRDQLKASIDHKCSPHIRKSDIVYIEHGANFGGTLNLFGGANKEVFNKINLVMSCPNIVSLDWDMPDYGSMLKKRLEAPTTYEGITETWCDAVSHRIKSIPSLKQKDLKTDAIIFGDSHTIAFSGAGDRVYRTDGKTLYGTVHKGIQKEIIESVGKITFCMGSIDIRHHILRHPEVSLKYTIKEYVRQANELADDVWFTAPVPVEFEGRRIPKSGFYKKTPFYGSWKDRWNLTNEFIDMLHTESKGKVIMPPKEWYTMDAEKYATTYMEHGSSFHIAPPYYRRNDWGVSPFGA
jgi:hypothetical protein|tara:strand:+ start:703 stop:1659 length:957 start_codon:yes stop_codon:yes gene_type:complete